MRCIVKMSLERKLPDLYKRLLDSLNTAVVLINDGCKIEYLNQAAEAILCISRVRALGQDISLMLSYNEFERRDILDAVRYRSPFTKREASISTELGKRGIVDFTLTPLELEDQTQFLVEIQAIGRLVKISKEESMMATQDTTRQLVRGLAHEVKNPLGGIRGAAQLLHAELNDPELREYTKVITDEADRLRNLVDGLLGPNRPFEMRPLNVHEVLDRVLTLVNAENSGQVVITGDYDPSLPNIQGDIDQLIQAFLNITRNGLQALVESGTKSAKLTLRTRVKRHLTIGAIRHPLLAWIDIEDNGPGVPADRVEEIFYPMITTRNEGSGLGLPIAQSIISNHKGIVECTSEYGRTIFSTFIPITPGGNSLGSTH